MLMTAPSPCPHCGRSDKLLEETKKSSASPAGSIAESRAEFEAWISSPPYEHMCDRNSDGSAWPGQYKRYETQIAWEAWQKAKRQ